MSSKNIFEIETTESHVYWAESNNGQVAIHRSPKGEVDGGEMLVKWSPATLRNLLLWAEDEKSVTFSLTGPLAHQVRTLSGLLSLTPEMFVWHAVKIFIDTNSEA